MAFRVNLFKFSKRSNSTLRPSGTGTAADCEVHEPVNIMAPVMKFNLSSPITYNYMYVQTWDRYYWIDSWTYNNGIWDATCSIDPLASWRNSIGNMTEYVLRSAYNFDSEIMDTTYPLQAETKVEQVYMPASDWNISANATGCHVVGVVGGNGLVEYYRIDDLAAFGAAMFGTTMWDNVVADDPALVETNIPNFMKAQFNPLQYVVSCIWYPFTIPTSGSPVSVKFGYFDSGYSAYKIKRSSYALFSSNVLLPNHPQISRGKWLNFAPYTRLRLSALPWGEIDLDTTKFANKGYTLNTTHVTLEAWLDPVTGSSKLYVMDDRGNIILILVGQIGVTEQLSQVLKDNLATVTGGLSAVAGVTQMATGNLIGGIATAVSGIGNAVSAQYPDVSTTGTNGARIAVCPSRIWVTVTHQTIVEEDRQNHGRPLCQRFKLKELPGYMMVSDPDVAIPATKSEIDAIKEYMTHGFFYE
ncbi:MAG: hypothetical protein IIZ93_16130 [Acidaminococcaceae bacterium]|nr:hypothetical protein [Acidaminococcaceae bacterium]